MGLHSSINGICLVLLLVCEGRLHATDRGLAPLDLDRKRGVSGPLISMAVVMLDRPGLVRRGQHLLLRRGILDVMRCLGQPDCRFLARLSLITFLVHHLVC